MESRRCREREPTFGWRYGRLGHGLMYPQLPSSGTFAQPPPNGHGTTRGAHVERLLNSAVGGCSGRLNRVFLSAIPIALCPPDPPTTPTPSTLLYPPSPCPHHAFDAIAAFKQPHTPLPTPPSSHPGRHRSRRVGGKSALQGRIPLAVLTSQAATTPTRAPPGAAVGGR